MAETDLLNDLMSSDPSAPATNGCVLLLRAEMKSEFKAVRSEMGHMRNDMDSMKRSIDLIAVQVAQLVARA